MNNSPEYMIVQELASNARARNTTRAYRSDWRSFERWATGSHRESMPASSETICFWIANLTSDGKRVSTIVRSMTSISQAHHMAGHPSPCDNADVRAVLQGLKRVRSEPQSRAKPLTEDLLKRLCKSLLPDLLSVRDRAILLIGFAGALRRSELVAIDIEQIEKTDNGIVLTIPKSKTDTESEGQQIGIPSVGSEFCPVAALEKWIALANIKNGAVFCRVGKSGKGKFWTPIRGVRLSAQTVNLIVKKRLESIGVNPAKYSAHSLRAGWTTSAAAIGCPQHVLMSHTRHKSVKIMQGYIRSANLFTDSPTILLLGSGSGQLLALPDPTPIDPNQSQPSQQD
jgi:integrase